MIADREVQYFICDRCKKSTDEKEGYTYEKKHLCTNCYRNEARRGIDDIVLQRHKLKIPKI